MRERGRGVLSVFPLNENLPLPFSRLLKFFFGRIGIWLFVVLYWMLNAHYYFSANLFFSIYRWWSRSDDVILEIEFLFSWWCVRSGKYIVHIVYLWLLVIFVQTRIVHNKIDLNAFINNFWMFWQVLRSIIS